MDKETKWINVNFYWLLTVKYNNNNILCVLNEIKICLNNPKEDRERERHNMDDWVT